MSEYWKRQAVTLAKRRATTPKSVRRQVKDAPLPEARRSDHKTLFASEAFVDSRARLLDYLPAMPLAKPAPSASMPVFRQLAFAKVSMASNGNEAEPRKPAK